MDFQPGTYDIDKIVFYLQSGRLALPEFQRDFVWSPAKVVELLDSVSRGWPVGSLLLLRGPQPFEARAVDGAPPLRTSVDVFVLDGQQRITALYHALADVSDVCYYVDFNRLLEDQQDYILWKRRDQFEKEFGGVKDRARRKIALIKEVADNELFYAWQSFVKNEHARELLSMREQYLGGLKSKIYRVPVVELGSEIELEALARIFETINRTGVKLNAFDLMVAVLYPQRFKLRDRWEDAQLVYPLLRQFEVDGIEVLKLIALWTRRRQQEAGVRVTVRGVRQGDVLAVPPANVKKDWERALSAYNDALKSLVGRFGVAHPSLSPPSAMILALAAFMDRELDTTLAHDEVREWYWTSIRRQTYSQGANTRVVADVDRNARGVSKIQPSHSIDEVQVALLEPVRRNKILLNGLGSSLSIFGARDIYTGELLAAAGDGPIVGRSLDVLGRGDSRPNEEAPVVSNVFARESSFRDIAAKVRKGEDLRKVCDLGALTSQYVDEACFFGDYRKRAKKINEIIGGAL